MNAHTPQTIMRRVAERWAAYRSSRAALAELDALPPSLIEEIAREANIDPATLHKVVASGRDADLLMERMLDAMGIDLGMLKGSHPAILQDAAINCSTCGEKARCRREIAAGTAAAHAAAFCPNQPTFASLA